MNTLLHLTHAKTIDQHAGRRRPRRKSRRTAMLTSPPTPRDTRPLSASPRRTPTRSRSSASSRAPSPRARQHRLVALPPPASVASLPPPRGRAGGRRRSGARRSYDAPMGGAPCPPRRSPSASSSGSATPRSPRSRCRSCSTSCSSASPRSSAPTRPPSCCSTRSPASSSPRPPRASRRRSSRACGSRSGAASPGRIAAERQPVAIEDVDHADILNPILREKGIRSLLGVPLLVEGRVIGVLHVGTLVPRHFTEQEHDLLQLAADRAALAIEHARLHAQRNVVEALQRRDAARGAARHPRASS